MPGDDARDEVENSHQNEELSVYLESVLEQMQNRFQEMSDTVVKRFDEIGNRLDDLEKSMSDLMEASGVEQANVESIDKDD
mmetsp:Transcript_14169/g.20942  ORF Transcript_14169/g.20942 Transcript_14169/m.20942 type:complete len:81 (-) Transcript_14169:15-257(-)